MSVRSKTLKYFVTSRELITGRKSFVSFSSTSVRSGIEGWSIFTALPGMASVGACMITVSFSADFFSFTWETDDVSNTAHTAIKPQRSIITLEIDCFLMIGPQTYEIFQNSDTASLLFKYSITTLNAREELLLLGITRSELCLSGSISDSYTGIT